MTSTLAVDLPVPGAGPDQAYGYRQGLSHQGAAGPPGRGPVLAPAGTRPVRRDASLPGRGPVLAPAGTRPVRRDAGLSGSP